MPRFKEYEYRPFSRLEPTTPPNDESSEPIVNAISVDEQTRGVLSTAQQTDPDTSVIYQHILQGKNKPNSQEMLGSSQGARLLLNHLTKLTLENDILFYREQHTNRLHPIVPGSLVESVLTNLHKELGHRGQKQTELAAPEQLTSFMENIDITATITITLTRTACGIEPTAVAYRAAFKREVPLDDLPFRVNFRGKPYKPATVQESLEYVKSAGLFILSLHAVEFTKLYRGKPVWFYHRRNFKGHFPPKRPRKSCTHGGLLITSNPCPICRDEYLVLDYQNVYLLKHFLHPQSAEILEPTTTDYRLFFVGLCQKQHKVLLLEIEKARDLGTIEMRLPFRLFDYADYYGDLLTEEELAQLESHVASGTDSGRRLEPRGSIYRAAAEAVTSLPPSLAGLIRHSALIPHVEEVATEPPATEIESPRLPNRYKMEEAYRKLLLRRRRSKTANQATGPLQFIAPQTRVRIVDNSEFSSIAAEKKVRKGSSGGAAAAQKTTASEDRGDDKVTDVSSFLRVGISATAKRKPMVIRVYNYRDRGATGQLVDFLNYLYFLVVKLSVARTRGYQLGV
ncbi:unnamed protein product [Schistocephalus solidus]|uniref:Small ribosomal subunit protein mS40 n=1 Tax=Schistocephalus solidus TaxID=70667 RepID=A0A3P7CSD9_SCHSO|nr:unnamed protein product [Schistocephalus solidus]